MMGFGNRRVARRHAVERGQRLPHSLKSPDGISIPAWDAEAADPIDYLASVIDLLPGADPGVETQRRTTSRAEGTLTTIWSTRQG